VQGNFEHDGPPLIEFVDVVQSPANMPYGRVVISSASSITEFVDTADDIEGHDD
jgi:hypothetical protein